MRVGDEDDAIFISIHAQAQGSFPGLFILREGTLLLVHRCRIHVCHNGTRPHLLWMALLCPRVRVAMKR